MDQFGEVPSVPKNSETAIGGNAFEKLRKENQHGVGYWSAREIQPMLGYAEWRTFLNVIQKAITSCGESDNSPENHFVSAPKMVDLGSGGQRGIEDYHLSRFACYLVAQNGDPRKPEVAFAQKYFAIQTRRQELSDKFADDLERVEMRKQVSEEFKELSGAARKAGVQNSMFGIFHDAGYKGLYGGLGADAIKARKSIPQKDGLMDRMGTTELAANQFRMTQTRDKLADVTSQAAAIQTHVSVGQEVRKAIERIGGTLPENIPAAEHIKHVEKRIKSVTEKCRLTSEPPALPPPPAA